MKVYIVMHSYDCEGYGEPDGVYRTRKQAEEAAKHVRGGDEVEIFEFKMKMPKKRAPTPTVAAQGETRDRD